CETRPRSRSLRGRNAVTDGEEDVAGRNKRASSLAYDRRRQPGQVRRREAKPDSEVAAIVAPPRIEADVRACFGAIEVRWSVLRERLLGDRDTDREQAGRLVQSVMILRGQRLEGAADRAA